MAAAGYPAESAPAALAGSPNPRIQSLRSRWCLEPAYRVVITGGTKGIGLAVAEEVIALGGRVFICARNEAEVAATVASLRTLAGDVASCTGGVAVDIATAEGRKLLIAEATAWGGGGFDCLVNNAGTNVRRKSLEVPLEEYETIVSVNMHAAYHLTLAAHAALMASDARRRVVFVSSVAGVNSTGSGAPYAMTKAACNQLAKSLACEWAKDKIQVNAVAPWVTRTPMLAAALENDPSGIDKARQWTPMGRPAEPQEIAACVAFLLLPCSSYVTGQVICCDGGLSANMFGGPTTE